MKAISPGTWKNILGVGGDILDSISNKIEDPTQEKKGSWETNKEREEREAREAAAAAALAEAEKKKKNMMMLAIGAVVLVLLFGKKLMK